MRDFVGMNIGRYHLVEQLGVGGMATVYKAFDTRLERQVAIKIIRREAFPAEQLDRVLKRFDREAKTLAQLTHPNIVGIIDYGDIEGSPYLVMEYLAGGTLKQRLGKSVAYLEAFQLLLPVAQALAYAHQKGVVHRDVKPANILITEGGQPMLTDFGIAKILEDDGGVTLTGTGVGVGTPEYMAPEQGMGREIDGRADVYALGVVLYELVTGRKPYTADTPMAVVVKHLNDPLPRPKDAVPDLPDWVEQIILKALAKKPEDRYQSMGDFAAALAKIEGHPLESSAAAASFSSTLPQSEPDLADGYEDETGEATLDMGETPPAVEGNLSTAAPPTAQPSRDAAGIPSQKVPLSYSEAVENDTGELTRDPGGGQPLVSPMPVQPARPKDFGRPTTTHGSGVSTIDDNVQPSPAETPRQTRRRVKPWQGLALAAIGVVIISAIVWGVSRSMTPEITTSLTNTPTLTALASAVLLDAVTTQTETPLAEALPTHMTNMPQFAETAQTVTPPTDALPTRTPANAFLIVSTDYSAIRRSKGYGDTKLYQIVFSPDGKTIVAPSSHGVIFFDVDTLEELRKIYNGTYITSNALSPDGRILVFGSSDYTIRLWDVDNDVLMQTLKGHTGVVDSITFSPDGSTVASGVSLQHIDRIPDTTIRLWDVHSGTLLQTLKGHTNTVNSIAFSPDGRRLASGSNDSTVRLWDVESGELLQTLEGHDYVSSVAFSPDGRRLASGGGWDNTIKLWDAESGALLQTLEGHTNGVTNIAYSPNGDILASGSKDGTIRLWDANSGALLQTLGRSTSFVYYIAFSNDGQKLAALLGPGTLQIWNVANP